jgi:hypothetical protein
MTGRARRHRGALSVARTGLSAVAGSQLAAVAWPDSRSTAETVQVAITNANEPGSAARPAWPSLVPSPLAPAFHAWRAAAVTGLVLLVTLVVAWRVQIAGRHSDHPYDWLLPPAA